MKWTDVTQLAEALHDKYPEVNPSQIGFVQLHNWVLELDGFDDDSKRGGERVLEAIQQAWIDEAE